MWEILIANNPNDDYNLTVELWCNNIHYGMTNWNHESKQYDITLFPVNENIVIPCEIMKRFLSAVDTLHGTRDV